MNTFQCKTESDDNGVEIFTGLGAATATGSKEKNQISLEQDTSKFSVNYVDCKTEEEDDVESVFGKIRLNFYKEEHGPGDQDLSLTSDQETEVSRDMDTCFSIETTTDFVKYPSNSTTQGITPEKFQVYQNVHTKDKPFQCKFCSESFPSKYKLRNHCNKHAGEKQFKCTVCPESFFYNYDLMKHEITHTKTIPFKCKYCGGRFSCISKLNRHQRTQFCKKKFAKHSSLKEHEKSHTHAFKCEICEKSFKKKNYLKKHEKRHENHDRTHYEKIKEAESDQELYSDTVDNTREDTKEFSIEEIKIEFPNDVNTKELILCEEKIS